MTMSGVGLWGDPICALVDASRRDRLWLVLAVLVAVGLHAAIVHGMSRALQTGRATGATKPAEPTLVIDIDPAPVVLSKPQDVAPAAAAPRPTMGPGSPTAAPARPVAAAGVVLTRQPDPNETLDLTGDGTVIGSAASYAGGRTSEEALTAPAVPARAPSAAAPTASALSPPQSDRPEDRSQKPSLAGGSEWSCPFPAEADSDRIDSAVVTIRVAVDAAGNARQVNVLSEPGHGFGREAQRCALAKHWKAGLDADGDPIEKTVIIHVRFER
jgi:protein TonB